MRAADRKPVPVRFQARDRARGTRALRARESGNARARPRSARATSRPRACRLRGIRSRAAAAAATQRHASEAFARSLHSAWMTDTDMTETLTFFSSLNSPPTRPERNSSKAEKMTAAVTAAFAAALANPRRRGRHDSLAQEHPALRRRGWHRARAISPPWWACPLSTRSAASKDDAEESIMSAAGALAAGTRPIDGGPPTASRGVRRGWLVRVSSHTSSV